MMQRFFLLLMACIMSLTLIACNEDGSLDGDFDPTPYLAEAFQLLTNYEEVIITPQSARWIYADDDSNLGILYLFTAFGRSDSSSTFYAMTTIYVNKDSQSLEAAFIDRIYYDELGATISSAQGYQDLYDNMLSQTRENSFYVEVGIISNDVISAAMQEVTGPNGS